MGIPNLTATPQNPELLRYIILQIVLVILAWLIGLAVRRVLASRMTMSTASATLTGLIGLWLGLITSGWVFPSSEAGSLMMSGFAAFISLLFVAIVALILARIHPREQLPSIAQMASMGESNIREFKSSARWNMRTNKRDDVMETVVAKTVCAFLNSGGGTLLLGVNDEGHLIGLAPDYSTLKSPDADRFELWMRDLWGQRLGTNASALPRVDFAPADPEYGSGEVCRVIIPPSPRPVYLKGPKGKGEGELWVRVGNSTRRLEVSDAVAYVSQRWPESVRSSFMTRVRMFFLLRHRDLPVALPRAVEETLHE